MGRFWTVLACAVLMGMGSIVSAQDGTEGDARQAKLKEIQGRMKEIDRSMGKLRKEVMQDPELEELRKAMVEAKKAFEEKLKEKIGATPAGKELRERMEALREEKKALMTEMRPPKKPKPARKPKKPAPGEGDEDMGDGEDSEM